MAKAATRGVPISTNEYEVIAERFKAGVSPWQIAIDLGRPHSTVLHYMKKLGYVPRRPKVDRGPISAGIRAASPVSTAPKRPQPEQFNPRNRPQPVQLVINLDPVVARLLSEAAARRIVRAVGSSMSAEKLAAEIIAGTVLRGSISRACALFASYALDKAAGFRQGG